VYFYRVFKLFLRLQEQLRSIVMSASVCLSKRISLEPHARSLPNFLCSLPMSVAQSSSSMFTIGRIAYLREGIFFPIDNVQWRACCKRDHSIAQSCHAAQGIIPLLLHSLKMGSAGKGWRECTAWAKCNLRLSSSSSSSSSSFFSSPNLSGRRLDVYHTSARGVALVRI